MNPDVREHTLHFLTSLFPQIPLQALFAGLRENLSAEDIQNELRTSISGPEKQRVLLCFELLTKFEANQGFLEDVLRKADTSSLREFTEKHFPKASDTNKDLRLYLFEKEPTAVILNQLRSGSLPSPVNVDLVVDTLNRALNEGGYDLLKDSALAVPVEQSDEQLQSFLADLQRIAMVVKLPEDISVLLRAGFRSAAIIAQTPLPAFVQMMKSSLSYPEDVHAHAVTISMRNEQLLPKALSEAQVDDTPVLYAGSAPLAGAASSSTDTSARPKPLLKESLSVASRILIDMDEIDSSEQLSVTSPAAYLVDLLEMLRRCPDLQSIKDPKKYPIKENNALSHLRDRRPDLVHLELTSANIYTKIPYIDLANEVMESFIFHQAKTPFIDCYNMTKLDTEQLNLLKPRNISDSVYEQDLVRQQIPLNRFPFHLALETIRSNLSALGVSRYELLKCFQSPLGNQKLPIKRAMAAERLCLSHEEFIAITKESFLGKSSPEYVRLRTVQEYWGYATDSEDMIDQAYEKGLPYIESQLLPRAGISFTELVSVLNTQFIGGAMVIEAFKPSSRLDAEPQMAEKLQDFRLYNVKGRAHTRLSVSNCDRLNRFLRLWLKWDGPIIELDEALTTLRYGQSRENIDGDMIEDLAALKESSDLAGMKLRLLLPLWGPICNRFLPSLFDVGHINQIDPTFAEGIESGNWKPNEPLDSHLPVLLASLELTEEDYATIKRDSDDLNLANVSLLYRASLLRDIFKIEIQQIPYIAKLIQASPTTLISRPVDFASFLNKWNKLRAWTPEKLHSILGMVNTNENFTLANKFTHRLREAKSSKSNVLTDDELAERCLLEALEVPKIDVKTLRALLQAVCIQGKSYAQALRETIGKECSSIPDNVLAGSLLPGSSTTYNFRLTPLQDSKKVVLEIDGIPVPIAVSTHDTLCANVELSKDSSYYIECSASHIEWFTDSKSDPDRFITSHSLSNANKILAELKKYLLVIDVLQLRFEEVETFLFKDLQNLLPVDVEVLGMLEAYRSLSPNEKFCKFVKWTKSTASAEKLDYELQRLTGWSRSFIADILGFTYPAMEQEAIKMKLGQLDQLVTLYEQASFLSKLGPGRLSFGQLAKCGPRIRYTENNGSISSDPSYEDIRPVILHLESASLASGRIREALLHANNDLRVKRQQVLSEFLIHHPEIEKCQIKNADKLFEFFLIDVQFGTSLQTSRLKQALSTVQLFVERCLLNMEVNISSECINQDRWSWMRKYQTWEANRRVFLYPENWLDPTLRDDKTELFRQAESQLMQKELNEDSVLEIIRTYIYGMSGLADLDIQAYHVQSIPDRRVYHFFGCSKTSPYQYYYRTMTYSRSTSLPIPQWVPWSQIRLDIPSYEVDDVGNKMTRSGAHLVPFVWNNQLHLFLPQIVLKSKTETTQDNKATAVKYWEIKLGWSTYRDGIWSAKQISKTSLNAPITPHVSDMRFRIDVSTGILLLLVESLLPQQSSQKIGAFVLCGSELGVKLEQGKGSTSAPTGFGKWTKGSSTWDGNTQAMVTQTWPKSRLALPSLQKGEFNLTWTIDFADNVDDPSGLVVNITRTDHSESLTWLSILEEFAITEQGNTSIRFSNALAPTAVKDANTSLKNLYGALGTFPGSAPKRADANFAVASMLRDHLIDSTYGKHPSASTLFRETSTPYAIYNWEICFHLVLMIVERLLATKQFALAISVARLVFDPTIPSSKDDDPQRCWRFLPFRDSKVWNEAQHEKDSASLEMIKEWGLHPFSPHAVARNRPMAYMKRFVMKYIEALVEAGDEYFRENNLESIPLALQRYVEASHIFGPPPNKIPKLGKPLTKTYQQLALDLDDFSNAPMNLELLRPFFVPLADRGKVGKAAGNIMGFVVTQYFSVSINPEIPKLRARIDDRLTKIRLGLDIEGRARQLDLFQPPINPGVLVKAMAQGHTPAQILKDVNAPMPNYRFIYLLQKTFELCAELKNTGATYLSIKEKQDVEAMMMLKIDQEKAVHDMVLELKRLQKEDALKSLGQLELNRRSPEIRLEYYGRLTGDEPNIPRPNERFAELNQLIERTTKDNSRMSPYEVDEMRAAADALDMNTSAAAMETIAGITALIPPISEQVQPMGIGITIGSPNWGQSFLIAASVFKLLAMQSTEKGAQASRAGRLSQQLQERRLQANLAGREIMAIDKQIEGQKLRIDIAEKDVDIQKRQMTHARETLEYLRQKYTNKELYSWLDNSTSSMFYETYKLALELAKKAEKAFNYETGKIEQTYIIQSFWEGSRGGLLCAEKLYVSLKHLEAEYMAKRAHNFEITKHCSIRQMCPKALLSLRAQGEASFDLSEVLFDMDFPGHYNRRIKSISVSIPCSVGPYTALNCTLSLKSHTYRISTEVGKYKQQSPDPRFRNDEVPIKSVAVCNGQQDPGVFELNFKDERYMPFEGAGAISSWHLALPTHVRQFNYASISDVIIHMRYTSWEGSEGMVTAAKNEVMDYFRSVSEASKSEGGLFGLLDLKNDFPVEWQSLTSGRSDQCVLQLKNIQARLPFYTRHGKTTIKQIVLLLRSKGSAEGGISEITDVLLDGCPLSVQDLQDLPSVYTCFSNVVKQPGGSTNRKQVKDLTLSEWTLILNNKGRQAFQALDEGFILLGYEVQI